MGTRQRLLDKNIARIEKRLVHSSDGCWLWTGVVNPNGYGIVGMGRRQAAVHRVYYELVMGDIPDDLVLDHLCRIRNCCNPAHLEPVTHVVNCLRGISPAAEHAKKTHCVNGHEFNDRNTYWRIDGRGRQCRRCRADRENVRARRLREIAK